MCSQPCLYNFIKQMQLQIDILIPLYDIYPGLQNKHISTYLAVYATFKATEE